MYDYHSQISLKGFHHFTKHNRHNDIVIYHDNIKIVHLSRSIESFLEIKQVIISCITTTLKSHSSDLRKKTRHSDSLIYHDKINPSMYLQKYIAFFFSHNTLTLTRLTLVCAFLVHFLDLC